MNKNPATPNRDTTLVTALVDAIYPVLIPVEPQDCAIQAKNHAWITAQAKRLLEHYDGWVELDGAKKLA